jgi:hypothetical protein
MDTGLLGWALINDLAAGLPSQLRLHRQNFVVLDPSIRVQEGELDPPRTQWRTARRLAQQCPRVRDVEPEIYIERSPVCAVKPCWK